jgi:hypothetical protein
MGQTTFTGPVRSGTIFETSGNALGNNIANVGKAVLAQQFPLIENGTTTITNIVLPKGSTIVGIDVYGTIVFGGTITVNGVDTNGSAVLAPAVTPAVGITPVEPATLAEVTTWLATISDLQVTVTSAAAGAGRGVLVVQYVQN